MNQPAFGISQADFDHCAASLREMDRQTWLATLLMNSEVRTASTVLWAFSAEIAAVPSRTTEPMAGEIRLQWWADALSGERAGEAEANPLARAVLTLAQGASLPISPLVDMVQASVADLYADGIADREAFETYAGETRSAMFQLVCVAALGAEAKKCAVSSGHAGVASIIADVIDDIAGTRIANRFRVPQDLLMACGMDGNAVSAAPFSNRTPVLNALADYGDEHLSAYRASVSAVPETARDAYLPLVRAAHTISLARKVPDRLRRPSSLIGQQWRLWRASRRGIS